MGIGLSWDSTRNYFWDLRNGSSALGSVVKGNYAQSRKCREQESGVGSVVKGSWLEIKGFFKGLLSFLVLLGRNPPSIRRKSTRKRKKRNQRIKRNPKRRAIMARRSPQSQCRMGR